MGEQNDYEKAAMRLTRFLPEVPRRDLDTILQRIAALEAGVRELRAAIIQRRYWGATTGSDRDLLDADDAAALASTAALVEPEERNE